MSWTRYYLRGNLVLLFPLLGRFDFCCRPATERTKQSSFEFDEVELFVRLCRIISLDSSLISAILNQFVAIFYIRDSINFFFVLFFLSHNGLAWNIKKKGSNERWECCMTDILWHEKKTCQSSTVEKSICPTILCTEN